MQQRWCGYVGKADEYAIARRTEINVKGRGLPFGFIDLTGCRSIAVQHFDYYVSMAMRKNEERR